MDKYNVFMDDTLSSPIDTVGRALHGIFVNMSPETVAVNSSLRREALMARFPDEMSLKIVQYEGTLVENYVKFCEEFPNDWQLLVLPSEMIIMDVVNRYKKFWNGGLDKVFVPARNGTYDLSGHLMFMHYFAYRKVDPSLSLNGNILELSNKGISFCGVQGVGQSSAIRRRQSISPGIRRGHGS